MRASLLKEQRKMPDAMKDLNNSLAITDVYVPDAVTAIRISELKKFSDPQKMVDMSRAEAETAQWIFFKISALRDRAVLYEEMGSPERARPEYERLCTQFNDAGSCKDVERLK